MQPLKMTKNPRSMLAARWRSRAYLVTSRAIGRSAGSRLRGLDKVHTEFGIVAMAHNLLKVASIRLAAFLETLWNKNGRKTILAFRPLFILGTF